MKNKKIRLVKYALITLIVTIIFAMDIEHPKADTINYNGIKMTDAEYNTLVNLGFTEDEIYHMEKADFDANKDLDAKLLAKTVKYYRTVNVTYGNSYTVEVTEDEYFNHEEPSQIRGTVYDYYKTVVSSISLNGSKYRYKVSTTWSNMPTNYSYDIIGIGFPVGEVSIYSSVYFNYRYADTNGNYTTSYTYANRKSTGTGGAIVYYLPQIQITSLGATVYFDVTRNVSTTLSMCGDYAHALSNISSSNITDYSITISGIGLGPSLYGNYDSLPCAMSYAS